MEFSKDSSMYGEGEKAAALLPIDRGPLHLTEDEALQHTMALSVAGQVVSMCSEKLWEEEKKAEPNPEKIKYWHELGFRAYRAKAMLDPKDHEKVATVLQTYDEVLREHGEATW
ncbi:MAG: hypothetical protein ACREP9_07820 [Candidatus Dormibacteraceae bacterium]